MADAATDEIADLVEQAKEAEDDDVSSDADDKPATTKRKRRKTNGSKKEIEKTMEQLDVEELLPAETPKPAQVVKTIGDMYAKYGIGDNPEFRVQVWRTWPKMAPGGKKFDGFYDTWDQGLTMEQIQADYGGGQYRIVVVGPHPSKSNTPKHYDSLSVSLAGEPNWDRVPRALQGQVAKKDDAAGSGFQIPSPVAVENPKLAETALKMMQATAESEREERRRIEDRYEQRRATAGDAMTPVIEAERRRSDDVIRSERERAEAERRMMGDRLREERERQEESMRRMERDLGSRPSIGQEIAALASAGLFKSGDDGMARDMLTQILEKHRGEVDALVVRNTQFIESLRSGHAAEISAIRDAHRREAEAEREASRSREARIEERLTAEREERRRDQDRFKEQIVERDQQWRDRMDSAKETMQSSWESRHQALMSTYENRIQWMQGEQDRLKQELFDAKAKQEERGDVFTQLAKMKEMQDVIKGFAPEAATATASSSGGIGITGGADWKETMAEGLAERAPAILQALMGGSAAGAQQPPQQYHEGQQVETPNGPMVVVRDPGSGQLALAPKEALEAHKRAVAAQQERGGLLSGPASRPRPRVMPEAEEMRRRGSSQRKKVSVVPHFGKGLPKPKPPWDGLDDDDDGAEPAAPPPTPRMTTRSRAEAEAAAASGEPMELSAQERQGLQMIAKHVHESVMGAEEPEEFVAKMLNAYDANVLKAVVGGYTTEQIAKGITQVEPGSAGATPAGQHFVAAAFRQLREALRDA